MSDIEFEQLRKRIHDNAIDSEKDGVWFRKPDGKIDDYFVWINWVPADEAWYLMKRREETYQAVGDTQYRQSGIEFITSGGLSELLEEVEDSMIKTYFEDNKLMEDE